MKEALIKAQEGGYVCRKMNRLDFAYLSAFPDENEKYFGLILNDPEFWKCLGKSQSWTGLTEFNTEAEKLMKFSEYQERYWKTWWHKFIDHLAENKDPEEFFKNLIK